MWVDSEAQTHFLSPHLCFPVCFIPKQALPHGGAVTAPQLSANTFSACKESIINNTRSLVILAHVLGRISVARPGAAASLGLEQRKVVWQYNDNYCIILASIFPPPTLSPSHSSFLK